MNQSIRAGSLILVSFVLIAGWAVFFLGPLRGEVAVTIFDTSGARRAEYLSLSPFGVRLVQSENPDVLAAVPAALGARVARIVRTRDESLLVVQDGSVSVPILSTPGALGTPQWSRDGRSIAFTAQTPEGSWRVSRAVPQGDRLDVGEGFRAYPSATQRTVALTEKGIALLSYADTPPVVVVESPTPVPVTTPFAVSSDGTRVAWIAPADRSLQVFAYDKGFFVPILLKPAVDAQSIVFSPDGTYLLIARGGVERTELELMTIRNGALRPVSEQSGFVELHAWRYE